MPTFPSKKIQNKEVHTAHRHREPRYHTTAWRALRQSVLRDEPLCRQCRDNGWHGNPPVRMSIVFAYFVKSDFVMSSNDSAFGQ